MSHDPRIPVTVITGFLGSGKTTLLNRVVTGRRRVAVIINEVGDVPIDGKLVSSARTGELVTLPNGCACCTVRGDLQDAVRDLLTRQRKRLFGGLRFEHMVVETSGIANPGPILQTFLVDDAIAGATRLDGVIAVADATRVAAHLDRQPEARAQVGYADRILLNHADRANDAALTGAEAAIRRINPGVSIVRTVRADVPVPPLLDIGGADPERWSLPQDGALHGGDVATLTLSTDQPLNLHLVEIWLRFVVGRRTWELMRLKGVLRCKGHGTPVIAQAVYQYLEMGFGEGEPPARSQIVVIGRDLDRDELRRGWDTVCGAGVPASGIDN